jgi:hypothetical protein
MKDQNATQDIHCSVRNSNQIPSEYNQNLLAPELNFRRHLQNSEFKLLNFFLMKTFIKN